MTSLFEESWQELWDGQSQAEPVGSVFTRTEIVDLILDLAEYRVGGARLAARPLLEPGCGDGAFITKIVQRLLASEREHVAPINWDDETLSRAIVAVDINLAALNAARATMREVLIAEGCPAVRAGALAAGWTEHADFLLWDPRDRRFAFVIGNPPYVRVEELPRRVLQQYRSTYATMGERADLYVAFIEHGLSLLDEFGVLSFIVANRWAKNSYGVALRRLIAERYHVRVYLNLEHTQPFQSDVSAYPCIVVLDRQRGAPTRAATLDDVEAATLERIRTGAFSPESSGPYSEFGRWYPSGEAWITTSVDQHSLLTTLADRLPALEQSAPGTKVGIGVATGADKVFVLKEKHPEIEASRQIPLAMASNIAPSAITWSGRYLVNPFADVDDGSLVHLAKYPGLASYLESNESALRKRHVARTRPNNWYRTIDRVWPSLTQREKLLLPDIQAGGIVGYDPGGACGLYPHHNVYFITSTAWPLRALQAILRSSQVTDQIRAHSVQLRGGSIRYMAQVLRQVRIPALASVPAPLLARLGAVGGSGDQAEIDAIVDEAFRQ